MWGNVAGVVAGCGGMWQGEVCGRGSGLWHGWEHVVGACGRVWGHVAGESGGMGVWGNVAGVVAGCGGMWQGLGMW